MERIKFSAEEVAEIKADIVKMIDECPNLLNFEISNKYIKEKCKLDKKTTRPTLMIDSEAYAAMQELVKQSSVEISWHALVTREEDIFYLYDVLVFPQINSPVSTTTDDEEFAEWQRSLIENVDFPIEHLRCHGHSHVNMGVYSSGIDDQYQSDILTKVKDDDFYLFLIMNKKNEMCALLYDFKENVLFETKDMDIEIVNNDGESITERITELIEKNCIVNKPVAKYRDYIKGGYYG